MTFAFVIWNTYYSYENIFAKEMKTDGNDSSFVIMEVKREPIQLPNINCFENSHVEIPHKIAENNSIKEEQYANVFLPVTDMKQDTVGALQNISCSRIVCNHVEVKLEIGDEDDWLHLPCMNKESAEQEKNSSQQLEKSNILCNEDKIHNGETSMKPYECTGERNYKCEICSKCFTSKKILLQHLKTHTGERNYKCKICDKCFTRKESLSNHVKMHTGEENYKCDICAKCYLAKNELAKHVKTHSGERNYKCEICNKCFARKDNLSTHVKIHMGEKNYKCEVCTKCFVTKSELSGHTKTHTGERNYKCEICNKCFARNENLSYHVKTHTGQRDYTCEICKKCFTRKQQLFRHRKIHTGERNFKCEICSKCFTTNQMLLQHVKTHTDERNYKCKICNKSFTRKYIVLRHLNVHTSERNFKCESSSKCRAARKLLLNHMVIHNGKRNCKCGICKQHYKKGKVLERNNIETQRTNEEGSLQTFPCNVQKSIIEETSEIEKVMIKEEIPIFINEDMTNVDDDAAECKPTSCIIEKPIQQQF